MASVNKVILVGNLGRDCELRYMPDGTAVANISIATSDTWKDKATGEKKEAVEWHKVVFFARVAEVAGEYLKKGSQVYIEGRLRTRKWQDKEGVDKYTTEIVGDRMQMLGGKPQGDNGSASGDATDRGEQQERRPAPAAKKPAGKFDDMEDDIPF